MKNLQFDWKLFLIISVAITLFLSFIDEGHYNFSWINSWENWLFFIIYVGIIFGVQLLFSKIISKTSKKYLAAIIGIPLALLILILIIFQ